MAIVVKEIRWKRTILEIDYTADEHEELCLYRVKTRQFKDLEATREGNLNTARLNLVMGVGREPLEAGEWILTTRIPEGLLRDQTALFETRPHLTFRADKEILNDRTRKARGRERILGKRLETNAYTRILTNPHDTHDVDFDVKVTDDLESLSRVFRYGENQYAYTAVFVPRYSMEDKLVVILAIDYFEKNRNPRVRKKSIRFLEKQFFVAFHRVVSLFIPKRGNRVLFFKENGERPTENMSAIRDRMVDRALDKQFVIKERYRNVFEGRQKLKDWLVDIVAVAGSDYIFIDDYAPIFNFITPRKGTVLTQVWHAGVGFKSVGYARFGIAGSPDPFQSGHRRYTYALVGNEHLREIYSEVFGVEEEALLATGMPRLDNFLDSAAMEEKRARLLEKYPWANDGRVILFAPTFRGAGQRDAYYPYQLLDFEALFEMCERTNSYFVFEMHHFISERPRIPGKFKSRLIDLSNESLNDLFHISDVLITDFSSCFYDYVLLRKPVVFYVPDKVTYCAVRGVQRPIDEFAPGVVCETSEEFVDILENKGYLAIEPNPATIDRCIEGGMLASDRAIDTILLGEEVPGVRV